ncbi:MAG: exonuclease SbcCD subunit D [Lachnospiraceae bacterium]|nr:exonuclease SbcCD subunit D [Bacillota bacterium]MDY2949423.1 exonuclease SbcCD subunit D [Lachnospiraceae bacterium]
MRFIHLSDLHIGKRVNGFPMLEDQRYILEQILERTKESAADAVIIAGDIYDKPVPSAEAVDLFDDFLVGLTKLGVMVFLISGNHDSAERISYAGRLLRESQVYISPRFDGTIHPISVSDDYGIVNVYLIPYIHPSLVRNAWPEEKIGSYDDAMRVLLEKSGADPNARNLAVVHQFVTAGGQSPEETDSEEKHVGGLDNVDASAFDAFDYVALGHLHGPQRIGRDTIRYAGSPLKYSFSEEKQNKSITLAELKEKGKVTYDLLPLEAKRDLRTVRGTFEEVTSPEFTARRKGDDYYRVILTDENDVPNALSRLRRRFYENLMILEYDNARTSSDVRIEAEEGEEEKEPIEVLGDLYQMQNGREMSLLQKETAEKLIRRIWGEDI